MENQFRISKYLCYNRKTYLFSNDLPCSPSQTTLSTPNICLKSTVPIWHPPPLILGKGSKVEAKE